MASLGDACGEAGRPAVVALAAISGAARANYGVSPTHHHLLARLAVATNALLLLIIAETTQQALLGDDFSVTNSALLIITLFTLDIGMSYVKEYSKKLDKMIDGVPLIILENGQPFGDRMKKARVDETDILTAARELHGLERLDQIKYAVLERSGGISIIPKTEKRIARIL